jgi:hypothetical protein
MLGSPALNRGHAPLPLQSIPKPETVAPHSPTTVRKHAVKLTMAGFSIWAGMATIK